MECDDAPLLSSRLLRDLFAARCGIKLTQEGGYGGYYGESEIGDACWRCDSASGGSD